MLKAREIIARSIQMHPSLFREALIKQAEMHDDYAANCRDPLARRGAENQRNASLKAYDAVGADDPDSIVAEIGPMVVALNVAAKLQCLPPHVRTAAAVEWDEAQAN